ncbi:MAG: hypothetical protein IKI63_03725, partial [Clostridia bacterium]|nr:hypothetical protein [Clostridia bacterium]
SQSRADIVFFGFCMNADDENKKRIVFPHVTAADTRDVCLQLQEQDCFGYTACKAFRRSVLKGVRFDETMSLFEDELFALDAMLRSETVYVAPSKYNQLDCYYCSKESADSLMYRTHSDMIRLKDREYAAWKHYLGESYQPILTGMANRAVSYCRYYIFEHRLPLKASYEALIQTAFYRDALQDPAGTTTLIRKGYFRFRWDWMIWKLKTTLK